MDDSNNPADGSSHWAGAFTGQFFAFQKIWMETFSKLLGMTAALPRDSAPPDVLREMRSGVFQGLAKSWDEFMRSPQFLEGMKQWMDMAVTARKSSNEFFTRSRHEMQATAREDIDTAMLAVRHMEKRLLARLEQLEAKVDSLRQAQPPKRNGRPARPPGAPRARAKSASKLSAAPEASTSSERKTSL